MIQNNDYLIYLNNHPNNKSRILFLDIKSWAVNWFEIRKFKKVELIPILNDNQIIKLTKPKNMSWEQLNEFTQEFIFSLKNKWKINLERYNENCN